MFSVSRSLLQAAGTAAGSLHALRCFASEAASKRLYVGNLAWGVTREDLQQAFAPYGNVQEAVVVADKYTGRSRGFGFVLLEDKAAEEAIKALNGSSLMGRQIKVNAAMEKTQRDEGMQNTRREYSPRVGGGRKNEF